LFHFDYAGFVRLIFGLREFFKMAFGLILSMLRRPFAVIASLLLVGSAFFCTSIAAQAQSASFTKIATEGTIFAGLMQASDGDFYFTSTSSPAIESCADGSSNYCAYIYQLSPAGVVSTFYTFQEVTGDGSGYVKNADGLQPSSLFEGTDGNFYGTCQGGGPSGLGTVFKISPAGVYTLLYAFHFDANGFYDGGYYPDSLVQGADGNLYGTTIGGGVLPPGAQYATGYAGTFFEVTTSGLLTPIFNFPQQSNPGSGIYDYPDGEWPNSVLQGDDGNFYLTMQGGSATGGSLAGSVNQLTAGGGVTVLYTFPADGSEGNQVTGPLVEAGNKNFYGMTRSSLGSNNSLGRFFSVNAGGAFQELYGFTGGADGAYPYGPLTLGSDGNLYGTTRIGGDDANPACISSTLGCGTVFKMTTAGGLPPCTPLKALPRTAKSHGRRSSKSMTAASMALRLTPSTILPWCRRSPRPFSSPFR
jgi:uncharacterized repeat protein (TIGR03803 family)